MWIQPDSVSSAERVLRVCGVPTIIQTQDSATMGSKASYWLGGRNSANRAAPGLGAPPLTPPKLNPGLVSKLNLPLHLLTLSLYFEGMKAKKSRQRPRLPDVALHCEMHRNIRPQDEHAFREILVA